MPRSRPPRAPQLLRASEAAELLNVTAATIRKWIGNDRIPYVTLPNGEPRIPLPALLSSLGGNYDLGKALGEPGAKTVAEARGRAKSGTGEFTRVVA